jgi:ubiquinone/menaquinone biosynthesis C-methylase UbiE
MAVPGTYPPVTVGAVTGNEAASRKYDEIADRYEEMFFYVSDLGQRLITLADPAAGARVLDIGAGRGAVARAALARDCVVTAVDVSPRMVARLAADYPGIEASVMDAAELTFPAGSFHLVTAGFVVQILPDLPRALAEMHRVLIPGGTVAFSLETQSIGRLAWLQDLTVEFFAPAGSRTPATPLTAARLDDLLVAAGFTLAAREPVDIPVHLAHPSALWDWLTPRGLAEAVRTLPPDRAEAFHCRFLAAASTMETNGTITLDFAATLHRATKPA